MLDELSVKNLALIREATLRLAPGFTVLTGETGAGKTALLSACRLLVGERAAREAVREGASELELCGRLFVNGPVGNGDADAGTVSVAASNIDGAGADIDADAGESAVNVADAGTAAGADIDEDAGEGAADVAAAAAPEEIELVITRRVGADGRSRATINGQMASVGELAELCGPLIDLCSQHEHQQLLTPAHHRDLLDRWAAETIGPLKTAYGLAFDAAHAAAAQLKAIDDAAARSEAELDAARFTLKTIDDVAPLEGEYEELQQTLTRAESAETLARAAGDAHQALAGDGAALESLVSAEQALLAGAAADPTLNDYVERTRSALIDLEDLASDLRAYRDRVDFDPETLEELQERLAALRGLMRRYGPRMEDVFAARAQAAELVALSVDGDERREAAEREVARTEALLAKAAHELAEARQKAAPAFAREVTAQMERLEMGGAALSCDVRGLERDRWTRVGAQSVEFLFQSGASLTPRPLARIASGGELSRVMLAIKVVLGDRDSVPTLVFDEIDAGIGGTTASAVGEVLVDLARTHQVIAVTHLAQIAACADDHYRVYRAGEDEPETRLEPVTGDARVEEIARMLSGDATEISLAHARELLTISRR